VGVVWELGEGCKANISLKGMNGGGIPQKGTYAERGVGHLKVQGFLKKKGTLMKGKE
jgi:hypothetical protein